MQKFLGLLMAMALTAFLGAFLGNKVGIGSQESNPPFTRALPYGQAFSNDTPYRVLDVEDLDLRAIPPTAKIKIGLVETVDGNLVITVIGGITRLLPGSYFEFREGRGIIQIDPSRINLQVAKNTRVSRQIFIRNYHD